MGFDNNVYTYHPLVEALRFYLVVCVYIWKQSSLDLSGYRIVFELYPLTLSKYAKPNSNPRILSVKLLACKTGIFEECSCYFGIYALPHSMHSRGCCLGIKEGSQGRKNLISSMYFSTTYIDGDLIMRK